MIIAYYRDDPLGYCPVKKYLEQYAENNRDPEKQANRKKKLLADIDAKILMTAQCDGVPRPPISFPLKEYGCIEIKHRKDKDMLIRILYFRHTDKIVLAHAFEKPDHYDTIKEKRKIDKQYKVAESRKRIFFNNPLLYEKYN